MWEINVTPETDVHCPRLYIMKRNLWAWRPGNRSPELSAMALANIITSVCLLSLGGVIVGAGLFRLNRLDRRRMDYARQSACRWHQWRVLEDGSALTCSLCGKRWPRTNFPQDRDPESIPSENLFL